MISFSVPADPDPVDWNSAASIFIKMRDRPPAHIIVEIAVFHCGRWRRRSYCRLLKFPPSELRPEEAWQVASREISLEAQSIELELYEDRI